MEVLAEVRGVEERLRPFIERTHSILGAATSADYNNNVRNSQTDSKHLAQTLFSILIIINVPFDKKYPIYILEQIYIY